MKKHIPLLSLIFLLFTSLNAAVNLNFTWKKIPEKFRQISTGSINHIWAVNDAGEIFQFKQGAWKKQAGPSLPSLRWIAAGSDGYVWGVGKEDGKVYKRKDDGTWEVKTPDGITLSHIAIGQAAYVFGVRNYWQAKKGRVYKWRASTNSWLEVPGNIMQIAVAPDGSVWGVNYKKKVYRREGSEWKEVGGKLKYIDITVNGIIFGISDKGVLHRRVGNQWKSIPGAPTNLRQVAVGVELKPGVSRIFGYVVKKNGEVYSFTE